MTRLIGKIFAVVAVMVLCVATCYAHDKLTLKEVLRAFPEAANFTSSSYAFHASHDQSVRTINGKKYELRFFQFETKKRLTQPFQAFAEIHGLLEQEARHSDIGYGNLEVFTSSQALKNEGFYYMISLREHKEAKSL